MVPTLLLRRSPVVLLLATCLLYACRPEPERAMLLDLAAEAAFAETLVEPPKVAVGTPEGRPYLDGGWSTQDERDAHGSFVWAVGETSVVKLPILEKRDLDLEIELRPFAWQDSPPQGLDVLLGDALLGSFELSPGPGVVELAIPAAVQKSGENELRLHWSWHRTPSEVLGAADRRSLAAAVYELRLGGQEGRPGEAPRADGQRLWLPAGSRIDYYVELPEQTLLAVRGIGRRGGSRLEVVVAAEEGTVIESLDAVALDLPSGLQRLRLAALGPDGGVMLEAPRLLAPKASIPTAEPAEAIDGDDPSRGEAPASRPSIVLYSIDTLRADALALWGGPVAAPALAAFASQSVIFEETLAQSSWTKASMASVLTGLLPPAHGAFSRNHLLEPAHVTLQELLSAAGYQTAAFNTNPNLTATFGFDQGFDHFAELDESTDAGDVVAEVEAWLEAARDPSRPLFLWVHTLDPHSPYEPPVAARERWAPQVSPEVASSSRRLLDDMRALRRERDDALLADLRALYHAEAAYSDQVFGDFLDLLDEYDLVDSALLLLSDHGEEFYEHGNLEHGRALYQESVHVPMLLRLPERRAARIRGPVQHVDVLPTLLELAGVPAPGALPGRSLLGLLDGTESADGPDILLHLHLDGAERAALVRYPKKLLAERGPGGSLGRFRLYDLAEDPAETRNLVDEQPLLRGLLAQALRRELAGSAEAAEIELDDETRRRLEALGYL